MENNNNKLTLPIAIVVAGVLIGASIMYTRGAPATDTNSTQTTNTKPKTANIKPVTSADHILGNPDAKIMMVEYSDTECPFCRVFADTMGKIVNNYGKDGTVAWVYRQFPIVSLHSKAPKESEATECVNQIAGSDTFWKYLQKIYSVTPGNNGLDAGQLPILAASFGVDKTAFQKCLDSGTFTAKIDSDVKDAIAAGGQGTPFTIMVPKNALSNDKVKKINDVFTIFATQYQTSPDKLGYVTTDKKVVLNGNMPYELIQQIIDAIVS